MFLIRSCFFMSMSSRTRGESSIKRRSFLAVHSSISCNMQPKCSHHAVCKGWGQDVPSFQWMSQSISICALILSQKRWKSFLASSNKISRRHMMMNTRLLVIGAPWFSLRYVAINWFIGKLIVMWLDGLKQFFFMSLYVSLINPKIRIYDHPGHLIPEFSVERTGRSKTCWMS